MTAYTVYMEQLGPLLAEWSRRMGVFVPVQIQEALYDFVPWSEHEEIAWDYDVAYNSIKRHFFPPRENLIRFDAAACTATPVFEAPDQLLFGVHPYDLKAVNQLDQIMEGGAPDQNYMRRREKTVIFALQPQRVAATAFWGSMGSGHVDIGFDLFWTKISPNAFYVEVGSPRGEELLLACGDLPEATLAEREAARRERTRILAEARGQGLKYPWEETPRLLARNWDSKLWRHKARRCLSCGSCVLVCPTCYCFEVREEMDVDMKGGTRFREWDGCMLPSFALVAGDHNFRGQALERYRHRYFRKGKYIYDKIGELGCVGCGRCVRACTAGIANPMAVYNELWEAEQHES
ncbi:MAG: 4Fe-4S dicluster domain-containing protein [Desulfovibrionaceae bacterium]|jgi:ferredoxin|nr:4Fe-4S dicluster domain-containing protein [Desulfovibrionaceae bacterium]